MQRRVVVLVRSGSLLVVIVTAILAVATATATGGAAPTASGPADGEGVARLGPGLARSVAGLEPGERVEVIVSAHVAGGLRALDRLGVRARRLRSAPIAFARLTAEQVTRLAGDPGIRSLWPRQRLPLLLDDTTQIVGADRAEQRAGVDGSGVRVAVLDTGIDTSHPDLPWHDKVLANYEVADPFAFDEPLLVDAPDTDDDGHGTHVASTVAGDDADGGGVHDGVAPGAGLYGYSINVGATIDNARALAAFDDVVRKRASGEPIVAASNSWGGGGGSNHDPHDPLSIVVERAYDEGLTVLFAAGNSGQANLELNTASRQCVMPWVVCVGATTAADQLVQFSSRGRPPVRTSVRRPDGEEGIVPAGNHDRGLALAFDLGVYRPTVSAPGVVVDAACAKAAACDEPGGYVAMSGTSMATPHVAGVVALMQSSRLDALGAPDLSAAQVIDVLESTANAMPGWRPWEAGAGLVDAYEAVRAVRSPTPQASPPDLGAAPRPAASPVLRGCDTDDDGGEPGCQGTVGPAGSTIGEHRIEVPEGTDRLELALTWDLETENLYMYAWGPGSDPGELGRVGADQESWGLLEGLGPRLATFRKGTVTSPEPGTWLVRVRGRVNAITPYTLRAETRAVERPSVAITEAVRDDAGQANLAGTAGFPAAEVEGTTRESVSGTALPLASVGTPRTHWFKGALPEADKGAEFFGLGPGPSFDGEPPAATDTPKFQTGGWYGNSDFAGNPLLAYWRAPFRGAIQGDVPVRLFVSSPTQSLGGQLEISLFEVPSGAIGTDDAVLIARGTVSGAGVGPTPTLVDATLRNVAHTVPLGRDLIVQVGSPLTLGAFASGYFKIWYGAPSVDAGITLPLLDGDVLQRPAKIRATDLSGGRVRIGWDTVAGADGYSVHRSTSPASLGPAVAKVPHDDTDLAHVDSGLADATPVYYRVAAHRGGAAGEPSDVVVGVPVRAARAVEVRAGRGPWEVAASGDVTSWEAVVPPASGPAAAGDVFAVRAVDQSGASPPRVHDFGR